MLNWATARNPQAFSDLEEENLYHGGFYGRCVEARDLCLGERDDRMLHWNGQRFSDLGPVDALFERAQAAGY